MVEAFIDGSKRDWIQKSPLLSSPPLAALSQPGHCGHAEPKEVQMSLIQFPNSTQLTIYLSQLALLPALHH